MTDRCSVHVVLAGTVVAGTLAAAELGLPRPGLPRRDPATGLLQRTVVVTPANARTGRGRNLGPLTAVHRAPGWTDVDMHVIRHLEDSVPTTTGDTTE